MGKELVPLVSICLITYNHEKYIKQAVDSILEQDMNFSYELLVADDASTDNTQQILNEYYSDIENVKLILRKKNSGGRNNCLTFQEARGKYIYCCEGDDYWIGRDGLQTLVDWMENHKEYAGVCGRRFSLSERTGAKFIAYDKSTNNKDISLDDFLSGRVVFDMCTVLFRNFLHDRKYDYRSYLACNRVGDITWCIYILLHGNVFQLDKLVGVYRTDRIKGACSYNVLYNAKTRFEDHIKLLQNLDRLIGKKLDYCAFKRKYALGYICSLNSMYEFFKELPYIRKKVGIKITLYCIVRWMGIKGREKKIIGSI